MGFNSVFKGLMEHNVIVEGSTQVWNISGDYVAH